MTQKELQNVFDRVLTWSPERQRDVADMLNIMEQEDQPRPTLTEEQVTEVKRRLAEKNPKYVSVEDAFKRFHLAGHENTL